MSCAHAVGDSPHGIAGFDLVFRNTRPVGEVLPTDGCSAASLGSGSGLSAATGAGSGYSSIQFLDRGGDHTRQGASLMLAHRRHPRSAPCRFASCEDGADPDGLSRPAPLQRPAAASATGFSATGGVPSRLGRLSGFYRSRRFCPRAAPAAGVSAPFGGRGCGLSAGWLLRRQFRALPRATRSFFVGSPAGGVSTCGGFAGYLNRRIDQRQYSRMIRPPGHSICNKK